MNEKLSSSNATMMDVARLAGVSQSCVSVVLNDAPGARIPEKTRRRVIDAAKALDYSLPSPTLRQAASRNIQVAKTTIAFIVDEISVSPHTVLHANGARDAAWGYERTVQLYVTRSNRALEAATVGSVLNNPAVGGVIYASSFAREVVLPPELENVPTVLLNCYTAENTLPTILADDVSGGFAATQYMAIYGHDRIAMVNGERWMDVARDRMTGYRSALDDAELEYDADLIKFGDWSIASGHRQTIEFMRLDRPPTAFYCASDLMALGCLDALADLGLSVPADVSVVGHNDIVVAEHARPPLSTCRPPNYEMGKLAVDSLMEISLGQKPQVYSLSEIECQLIVRSSVAKRRPTPTPAPRARSGTDIAGRR